MQKIINIPDFLTALMFSGGAVVGFFFPELLFTTLLQIKGEGTSYTTDKLSRIYELMKTNPALSILGGGLLVGIVLIFKKILPLVVGIIIGLTLRMFLINTGFSEPNFLGYVGSIKGLIL